MVGLAVDGLAEFDFESIAFTGVSGCILGPSIALAMDKTMICVRKNVDDCHSNLIVEGDYSSTSYIIVDDSIASGKTAERVREQIHEYIPKAKCLGVLETYKMVSWPDRKIKLSTSWMD